MFEHRYHLKYFSQHIDQEIKEIYWETIIASLALSLVIIFEPIFLYNLGYPIKDILLFYILAYGFYMLLIFPAAKTTSKLGFKRSIFISNIFYVCYWVLLFNISNYDFLFFTAPFFFALQKSFFWPAYNADLSLNSKKKQRGREVGALFAAVQIVAIVAPFLGGVIVYEFGYLTLFIIASTLMMFSIYPLLRSAEIYSKHQFHFRNFWTIVKNHSSNFFGYWGFIGDSMLMTLWPIVVFLTVSNVFGVGVITSVASAVAAMLMLYIGRLTDKMNKLDLIRLSSILYGLTWVFRFLAKGVGSVLAFDTLTRFGKGVLEVEVNALTFEIAGNHKQDFALAYSVFYEFSLSVGKILIALLGIWILSVSGSINMIFLLAGIFTMFFGFLKK